MPTKEELSEQLVLTQKLAASIDQMARSMERVESSFGTQITAVEKLTRAIEQLKGQDLGKLNQIKLDNVQKEFKDTEKQVTGLTGRMKDLGNRMAKKFPTEAAVGAAALSGFVQGIRNVLALGKGVTGFFAGFVEGAASIAASIIAIPFKMFNALVDMAAAAGGGMNELAVALEKIRKEFGDLKGPAAGTIIDTSKHLKNFSDTGLSAFRIFGTVAERLEHVTKIAQSMGATFGVLTNEFKENGGALLAFEKGLDGSGEGMKQIAERAIAMGKPMTKVFIDMTKQTLALGKAFDIDQKLIGKDMVKALADVKHFGSATVKEIGQASVYARKLGLELDKITGTLDAFETFDSAAENAAKLSQSFGVTVDAFKLMDAQSPAEQLDMLRKSMAAAGQSTENMSRQQLKLLAQTTGLDEATAKLAFSSKNQGVSLDKIKKQSEAAEKKTLTQAEAMSKLADSIERMVKSGAGQEGGFWQMFVKGFLGGIQASKEFSEVIWNIKRSLQIVYFEGVRLGKAFVEWFPGVKQFLGGIADFFNPAKFKTLAKGVVDVLIQWMKDLNDPNGKASFSSLMDKLKEKFFDFFDMQSASGKKMVDGFKTIFKTITKILAEAIKWAADKVKDGIQFIIDLVTGKQSLAGLEKGAEGGLGFLAEVLAPLGDSLVYAWKAIAPKLWELVKILGQKLFKYLTSDEFLNLIKPALPYVAGVLFGPAFTRSLLSARVAALGKAAIGLFTSSGSKKVMEEVAKKAASEVMEASKKVPAAGAGASGAMEQAGKIGEAAQKTDKSTSKVDWKGLASKLLLIAGVVAIGLVALWVALKIVKGESLKDILKAGVFATTAMIVAGEAAVVAWGISTFLKKVDWKSLGIGLLAVSAVVLIVGLVAAGLTWLMKQAGKPEEIKAAGDIMLKMSLVFLAMIPLILAATAMGALLAGPQAPFILAAMAAGLAVISGAVAAVAGIAMAITRELAQMKVDAQFQQKVDAFLGIMKAIQAFADTLVKLIGLMTPSFGEIISGKAESFTEKVNASTKLIKQMVGQRGQGFGMIGIIETVMQSIKDLNIGGPGMIEAANVFSNVMQGITGFMQAAAPPEAFYTEGGSFIHKLVDPTHNFQNLATDVGYYAKLMREGAMTMLTGSPDGKGEGGVLGIIKTMSVLPVPDPTAAGAIANLISSTAGVLKALTPSPETMKAFQTTVEQSAAWGLMKTKVEKLNVNAIKTTVETMGKSIQEILPVLVDNVIGKVVSQSKNLTKEQIENVKVMAGIIASVSSIAGGLSEAAKGKEVTPVEVAGTVAWATKEAPNLGVLFKSIAEHLPALFSSIITMVTGLKIDAGMAKKLEDAKKIFEFMTEIPKLAQSIKATHGKEGGDVASIEPMIQAVKSMTTFMQRLTDEGGHNLVEDLLNNVKKVGDTIQKGDGDKTLKIADTVKNLFSGLSTLGTSLKQVTTLVSVDPEQVGKAVANVVNAVVKILDPLNKVQASLTPEVMKQVQASIGKLKDYSNQVMTLTKVIKTEAVGEALSAASDMVKKANELDQALSDGIKINTPQALMKLATAAGMGSKTNYTIKNKDIVITINMNVTMNAADLEKALILRGSSFVRQRLDYLAGESKAQPLLGGEYNQGPSGVAPLAGSGPK